MRHKNSGSSRDSHYWNNRIGFREKNCRGMANTTFSVRIKDILKWATMMEMMEMMENCFLGSEVNKGTRI